jgi:hypothetical protein
MSLLFDGPDFCLFGNPSLQLKPKEGGNSNFWIFFQVKKPCGNQSLKWKGNNIIKCWFGKRVVRGGQLSKLFLTCVCICILLRCYFLTT